MASALLAILLHPAGAAAAAAADRDSDGTRTVGIRLIEVPASRLDDPRALSYIVDHVNPGATIKRRLEIANSSPAPVRVQVYAGAASVGKGGFAFAPEGVANELTSWITLDRTVLELGPRDRETVRATIAVPETAVKGERYGVIWAQVSSDAPGPRGNVALVNRVGVRAYLDVGPGGDPPTDFTVGKILPQRTADGRPRIVATVANTGERAVDLDGEVTLSDGPSALRAGPFPIVRGTTLAPGHSGDVEALLGQELPNGPWAFRLTLRSGQVERTVSGRITFPDRPGTWGLPASMDSPLGLGMVLAGMLAGATVMILWRLRRSLRRAAARAADDGQDG
ncbi:hypothetical protein ACGF0J_04785 [Nonomuraea sp. NPDC047897]|uniref:hypothetical protein n=1 Tax=Nonomuraea sp. NPDC047897 TaxID=3364346 RepID=UPI0037214AE5